MSVTEEKVNEVIYKYLNVTSEQISEKRRTQEIIEARQIKTWLLSQVCMMCNSKVAKITERDHSTVVHNKKVFANYYTTDKNYRYLVDDILKELNFSKPMIFNDFGELENGDKDTEYIRITYIEYQQLKNK